MDTSLYMIRHAVSPYLRGQERNRGLSEQGAADARRVKAILKHEDIAHFVSSPYARAVATMQPLAEEAGKEITLYEGLREREFGDLDREFGDEELLAAVRRSFEDRHFKLDGGESAQEAEARAVPIIEQLLGKHAGSKIAIGTHGNLMAIIMHFYNKAYGFDFLLATTKPDIYKMEFAGQKLVSVERLWQPQLGSKS
ncbi:2,3-bisphosphoglycerate-dependent phosphoglycerate mutase [Paenibacillus forsythiae]|uniref:2,3-bisphosphoglycerate-dependent phosphoglycerate mutase n=1 Tax=Paenibacillus forsythiae TaxID=365616 RepID=A0ABU3HCQ3_9BACL|nr:histidine phosphatase family protein [Paenibacillus forsythiae]MDT3428606.1 2,3-bisphosphoglycerate-dependent phosphoglycerate mutase [Paenibacillus forsythiae]